VYQNNNELDCWLWSLGSEEAPRINAAASIQNLHAWHVFSRQQYRPYILRISYSGSTGVKLRIL
jgi:hypothetical protein